MATRDANEAERLRVEAGHWCAEAERLAEQNVVLRAREAELEGQVAALSEKVATLARLAFGDSSEKRSNDRKEQREQQLQQRGAGAADGDDDGRGGRRRRGQRPGSRGHGRRDYSRLDTVEEVHDVAADQRCCAECGAAYEPFGEETCEQIDWQVRVVRVVHRRKTYRRACRCAVPGVVAAAVPPKPIAKGMFTCGFLARLLVDKYVGGRPLSRIVAALANDGLDVAEGTLVGALRAVSELLAPLDAAIRARNARAGHVHVDETSWKVFEDVAGKANQRWWLWVFVAGDSTVFTIEPSRSTKVLADHLGVDVAAGSLAAGRRLLVSSDFFTVYQALARVEGVDALWCWAHIRRYFVRAGDAHPAALAGWTAAWLGRIGALYAAHHTLGACQPGSAAHASAEADLAAALDVIDTARAVEAADPMLHPAAGKVLSTLDHEWEGLARHQAFPELALDNNTAERALRNPVVGRKNYYGSGSVWAAVLSGRVWTVTATAQRTGCNPLVYLGAYLGACAAAGARAPTGQALTRFLPWAATEADLAAWRGTPGGPAP